MIVQDAVPPYTMKCLNCGISFEPTPAKSGPDKGKHTPTSLNRNAHDHRCPNVTCDLCPNQPEFDPRKYIQHVQTAHPEIARG